MKTASMIDFSFSCVILDHLLLVINYWIIIIVFPHNSLIIYCIIGKKKHDTKNQRTILFSDLCTVSDKAFGRLALKDAAMFGWKSARKNVQKTIHQKSITIIIRNKIKSNINLLFKNKRFSGWPSDGIKRYDEILNLAKNDQIMNKKVKIEYKDLL